MFCPVSDRSGIRKTPALTREQRAEQQVLTKANQHTVDREQNRSHTKSLQSWIEGVSIPGTKTTNLFREKEFQTPRNIHVSFVRAS
jgi:hypothetical protein